MHMQKITVHSGAVQLQCQPNREGNWLVFPYTVQNNHPAAVLVMDAMPRVDRETRETTANDQAALTLLAPGNTAVIGKLMAPVPQDRLMTPDLPLCVLLQPGEVMQRLLRIPLPLAEHSPYLPELRLREYDPVALQGCILAIGWWQAQQPGLQHAPAAYAPGHHVVAASAPRLPPAQTAMQRFPINKLEMLKRRDDFPRQVPLHPALAAPSPDTSA